MAGVERGEVKPPRPALWLAPKPPKPKPLPKPAGFFKAINPMPVPGTPQAAAKVAHINATKQKYVDFLARRHAAYQRETALAQQGKQSYSDAERHLQEQGFLPDNLTPVHGVGGFVAKTIGQIADSAVNAPGGMYGLGRDVSLDTADMVQHPLSPRPFHGGTSSHPRIAADAVMMAKSTVEPFEHPLRDPGYLALNLGGALAGGAGAVARGAAAVDALRAGEGLGGAVARGSAEGGSLLHAPPPRPRVFQVGDQGGEVRLLPSRNKALNLAQTTVHDPLMRRALAKGGDGLAQRYANARLGGSLAETRTISHDLANVPANQLAQAGKGLDATEQHALRLAAENSTPDEARDFHLARMQQAGSRAEKTAHAKAVKLAVAVKQRGLLTRDSAGNVVVNAAKASPKLVEADRLVQKGGELGDRILEDTGQMTAEGLRTRRNAPSRVRTGATYSELPVTEEARQAALLEQHGQQSLMPRGAEEQAGKGFVGGDGREGRSYLSYRQTEPAGSQGFPRASAPVVGKVRGLVSRNKTFKGASLEQGAIPTSSTRAAAINLRRAIRYTTSDTFRKDVARLGTDVRQSRHDILVNTQELKNAKVPDDVRVALGQKVSTLDDIQPHVSAFEKYRRKVIPEIGDLEPEAQVAAERGEKVDGFKWVHKSLVGDLARPYKPTGRLAKAADTINAAKTAATVYLKPGHISTRVFTNAATNIIQGSATPVGIARSASLWRALDGDTKLRALAAAGEGGIHALPAEAENVIGGVARKGAGWWSQHVDAPFRFNSFSYEARKAGFRTPEQIKQLLTDPRYRTQLDEVAKRANRESIAYNKLNPTEKDVLRRVFWFYPWLKGSTVYAGHIMLEHPIKSAAIGQVGELGQKQQQKDLGPVPSFEAGLFKVGGSKSTPLTVNPASLSPLSTPAEIAKAGVALAHGHEPSTYQPSQFFTPTLDALGQVAYHLTPYGGQASLGKAGTDLAKGAFTSGLPEATLWSALHPSGDQSKKIFPANKPSAVSKFGLLGPLTPRPTNVGPLNAAAHKEQRALMNPSQRVADDAHTLTESLTAAVRQTMPHQLDNGQLPQPIRQAIQLREMRSTAYLPLGKHPTQTQYWTADVQLAEKLGFVNAQQAAEALTWGKTATDAQLRSERGRVSRSLFGGQVLTNARKALRQAGATLPN